MGTFVNFMNNPLGRGLRIALGVVLIYLGLTAIEPPVGYLVVAVGLVPLAFGAIGRCLVEFVAPGVVGSH
jgi:hypothetical protein